LSSLVGQKVAIEAQAAVRLALCPGLFTPAFVACSTNVGEVLVKLITCKDVPGHWVDVWRSGTFLL